MIVVNPFLTFDFNEQQIVNRLCCAVSFSNKYEYFALVDSETHIPFRIGRCELGNSLGELCAFSIDKLKICLDNRDRYINDLSPNELIRDLYGDFKSSCNPSSVILQNPTKLPSFNLLLTGYYADFLNIGVSYREKHVEKCDITTFKSLPEYKKALRDIKDLKNSSEPINNALEKVLSQTGKRFKVDNNTQLSLKYSGELVFEDIFYYYAPLFDDDTLDNSWFIPQGISDLINYTISYYIAHNIHFRKCVFCERFFALTDGYKSEYCKRDIPSLGIGKTCRSHGKTLMYGKRIKDDPIRKAYTRSYRTHNARVRNGIMTKFEFDSWAKQAQEMRDKCLQGLISLQELKNWLNQDKLRNTAN